MVETEELWLRYHTYKRDEDHEELIVTYLYVVKLVVGRLAPHLPNFVKLDDLYSSGVIGLMKAVERFDPSRECKFQSYAMVVVKGAIIDELRKLDWIPRSVHQKAQWMAKEELKLAQKLGRDPNDEELAIYLGMTNEAYADLLTEIRPCVLVSLNSDSSSDDEEGITLSDRIADVRAQTSFEAADRREFHSFLEKALSDLPTQERQVLTHYYFDEMTLKQIGTALGVSESRISQIHTKALLKLKTRLKAFAEEFSELAG